MTKTFTYSIFSFAATLLVFQSVVCWAVKKNVNDSTGLYIKHNSLYIVANGTGLTTFGNLYLDSVPSVGQGTLTMQSNSPKTLTAKHSTIANLAISNPTVVTLVGDLHILQSLSIEQGIFDASRANLYLTDTSIIHLQQGGRLLKSSSLITAMPLTHAWVHTHTQGNCLVATQCTVLLPPILCAIPCQSAYTRATYRNIDLDNDQKPPELF
jgi:hypothetical protein